MPDVTSCATQSLPHSNEPGVNPDQTLCENRRLHPTPPGSPVSSIVLIFIFGWASEIERRVGFLHTIILTDS